MKTASFRTVVLVSLLALGSGLATAQRHDRDDHDGRDGPRRGMVLDSRYQHNHYYPSVGFRASVLPAAALSIGFGRDRYWFHGGVWYRPYGGGYTVVLPPPGVILPILPPEYVTVRFGGMPYYYADGVYYSSYAAGPGYVVVAPPAGIAQAPVEAAPAPMAPPPPPAQAEPIIYPRNRQTAEQTESDRQECNRWATTQPSAMNSASVFSRAVEACMDGRGYTMK